MDFQNAWLPRRQLIYWRYRFHSSSVRRVPTFRKRPDDKFRLQNSTGGGNTTIPVIFQLRNLYFSAAELYLLIWAREQTCHPVVGQVNSVGPLINQNVHGRIRGNVVHMNRHFFHDERIPHHQTQNTWAARPAFLAHDFAEIETDKFHQPGRSNCPLHDLFKFAIALSHCDGFCKCTHVGMTDLYLQLLQGALERLG